MFTDITPRFTAM